MQIDLERSRQYLKQFQFQPLFVEELGWDNCPSQPLPLLIENKSYTLKPVAEKRGQVVYTCLAEDGAIPNSVIRTKIHKEVSLYSLENVLIYIDQSETEQVWQWVRRDPGKPKANRFHQFHRSQSGDSLLQKLEILAFSFEDEERGITVVDSTSRSRRAFDVDRITKKFYERFKKEHGLFLKFIAGIRSQFDQEWYCSLMLNRLMFVYFIQKKGFLDGNTNYLRDRLQACQSLKGQDSFHSFYRYFLLKLFHSGLGDPKRTSELEKLLGKVPYLNGGLFEVHQLEETYQDIQIPDQAFEKIFDFFDEYQWHLDDRPLHNDREINPDVLGYIFEKYINEKEQKQKGAYYTKEDITGYISKNAIIPFLFNAAEKACSIAFHPDGSVWRLLKDNPNRYIYMAMQKGVDLPLPDTIASGILDVFQRQLWNRSANSEYALPTETWREHIARRQRCLELRQKLAEGEIHSIDDLITLNLDIRQFAQDVIENCEGSELLRAFYDAICQVSILDPTCGSGAFLFAALNILDPLYDACLERMQVFLDDLKRSDHPHHPETFGDFRQVLDRVAQHPNRRYFILKSIILSNLYGVDIMEEATEICKLRLFLKLVSQVERDPYAPNYGLEPLPDIDFNIRAGNTLVGFANYEEVRKAVEGEQQKKLDLFSDMERIDKSAMEVDQAFQSFRAMQIDRGINAEKFKLAKLQLRQRLRDLNQELNSYLADTYEVGLSKKKTSFESWLITHQPFHWFVAFYNIMNRGGFDVIVGNPPYVELSKVRSVYKPLGFRTESCGNLYALCIERSIVMLRDSAWLGFVVQQPLVSTQRMQPAREFLLNTSSIVLCSTYDDRPSKLFDGIHHARIAITISQKYKQQERARLYVTSYKKWYKEERKKLFNCLSYTKSFEHAYLTCFPKISSSVESSILHKMSITSKRFSSWISTGESDYRVYYKITGVGHWFTITARPPKFFRQGIESSSTRESFICFDSASIRDRAIVILNSSLFYWFYQVRTNCRDFNPSDYKTFPVVETLEIEDFSRLSQQLQDYLDSSSTFINITHGQTGAIQIEQFKPREAKSVVNEIDRVLAKHYGFTSEELDFIVNYDIKYRMGRDTEDEE
ncbi:MAG: Eco57I restriction-modification methylase domain-containing protein [Myxacorys chilensis ATA2-1-KO14]|jgi:hypothetical protein|nr:Eco57I restriction-modification methylase domain-containing protein [Myxacorys chilensis ATA2-1-KO14]